MVNVVAVLKAVVHVLVKLAGLTPQTVEIAPGTVMRFWAPKQVEPKKSTQERCRPNKPVVVFAHAFAGDGILMWFPQVLALTFQYDVYVPDLLFFGDSATSRPDRSLEFQAKCLATGLRKLGVEKCTVVGLSYGGMVGFKIAAMYPELVDTLVVSSTVIELTESISTKSMKEIGVSRWSELLLPETVEGVKLLLSVGTHKWWWFPDFLYNNSLEVLFSNRKEKAEILEALVVRDEDSTNITTYSQRIYFLWGNDDKIFNLDLAQTMKEQIGEKATLQWIKNAGHLVHLERPFAYNTHLKRILSSTHNNRSQCLQ